MPKPRRQLMSDELREAIRASGLSQNRICIATEIDPGLMCRFLSGKSMLSLRATDKVAAMLDLHISTGGKKGKRK